MFENYVKNIVAISLGRSVWLRIKLSQYYYPSETVMLILLRNIHIVPQETQQLLAISTLLNKCYRQSVKALSGLRAVAMGPPWVTWMQDRPWPNTVLTRGP